MGKTITTETIIEALRDNSGIISMAAKKLGIDDVTIRKRAKRSRAIREVIENSREELVDLAELSLKAAVLRGEPWAIALVLKTLGAKRGYSEKNIMELFGKDGGPVELALVERIVDGNTSPRTVDASSVRLLS